MAERDDFSGDVSLEDLTKVFRAHGVHVEEIEVEVTEVEAQGEDAPTTTMIKIQKGDRIDVIDADPIIYRGKAHRLARAYDVPVPELYKADQYKSR